MNAQAWIPQVLIACLALVMLGLGLSLAMADFRRVLKHPKAVCIALLLQMLVLLSVPPLYAVGLMLLAASPGGVSANLFSHLFGGNVAMNISLTAINTVASIISLPLIGTWAIAHYADSGQVVPLQLAKVIEVVIVVLVPVAIGMAVRSRSPGFAARSEKPMKIFSALVLAAFALLAIVKEWSALQSSFMLIGPAVVAFNVASLLAGYYVSRVAGLDKPMSTAISYEIGIHNSTLAMFIALSVLNDFQLALPAALYSVSMYITASLFGLLILKKRGPVIAHSGVSSP